MSVSDTSRPTDQRVGQGRSQKQFNFNRAAKLGMLDRMVIPVEVLATHRERIGSARGLLMKIKALLRAIDSFAREDSECFASVASIGKQIGCSERTTQRYLIVAKLLGLVTVIDARHHTTSIHDINWNLVWEWSQPTVDTNEGRQQRDEGRQEHGAGDNNVGQDDNAVTQNAITRKEAQIKTPLNRDGFLKCSGTEGKDKPPEGGASNCGGWPKPITIATLSDREQVKELFEFAVAPERGWVHQDDRHRFHTLAARCARAARNGSIQNAGAVFSDNVKNKRWYGSDADEQSVIRAAPRVAASPDGDLLSADAPLDPQSHIERLKKWNKARGSPSAPIQTARPTPASNAEKQSDDSLQ